MRTGYISTLSLVSTPRTGFVRMQSDLARLNTEVTTGRLADAGLTLGAGAGKAMRLHLDTAALDALSTSNATATARLKATDNALSSLSDTANGFLQQLIASSGSSTLSTSLQQQASAALAGLTSTLNTADGGDYIFAGINSGAAPMAAYDGAPKAAVDAAFQAAFGATPGGAGADAIDSASMATFLDGAFSNLFADPAWGNTWSSASDQPITSRIDRTQTVATSVSANETAMRKLAMAYTMISGLGVDQLNDQTRQTVIDKAQSVIGEALNDLTNVQAQVGATEKTIDDANSRMTIQRNLLDDRINTLEGVDPAEAKVKIDTLTTQIEMSYSLTTKLLNLSILNYQ